MSYSDQLRESLLHSDDEFRQLAEEHEGLKNRLAELSRQLYRSTSEEGERATLKKRKLQLKDRMEDMLRRHRSVAKGQPASALQPQTRG